MEKAPGLELTLSGGYCHASVPLLLDGAQYPVQIGAALELGYQSRSQPGFVLRGHAPHLLGLPIAVGIARIIMYHL